MATQKANAAAADRINQSAKPSNDSFRLPHLAVERAKRIKPPCRKNRNRKRANPGFGIVAVNILAAIASYATDATMACWPSVPAISRDTTYSEEIVSHVLAQFEKVGIFERKERWKQSTVYTWIRSDAQSGYTILSRKWWQRRADLGDGRGLFVILHAASDGRPLAMNVKKECLSRLGTSRAKLYRLLPALKAKSMVTTEVLKDATLFKVEVSQRAGFIANEVSQRAAEVSQRAAEVSQRAAEVSQRAAEVSQRAVSGVSTGGVKGTTTKPEVDFEVKAHNNEDSARRSGERPVSHSSDFKAESKSKTPSTDIVTGTQLAECYQRCYEEKFGFACPWDDGDEKAAARAVARLSCWGPDAFERCFENLFASKDGRRTKKPSVALKYIHEYIDTPMNGFSRPLTTKDTTLAERQLELRHELDKSRGEPQKTGAFHRSKVSDYADGADAVFTDVASEPKPGPTTPARPERIEATVAVVNFCPNPFQATIRLDEGRGGCVRCWVADQIQQGMLAAAYEQETLVNVLYVNDDAKKLIVSVASTGKESPIKVARAAAAAKRRRDDVTCEILLDEELDAWAKWDAISSDDERWADDDLVRDRAVARDNADHDALLKLQQEAVSSPEFETTLAARLAESDDLRRHRERQRWEKRKVHGEHQRERERERRRREWKEQEERVLRELAGIAARRKQAEPRNEHRLSGVFT